MNDRKLDGDGPGQAQANIHAPNRVDSNLGQTEVKGRVDAALEQEEWGAVPDDIAQTPHFKAWISSQESAGNRLDGAKVVFKFYVAGGKFLLYWGMQARVWVEAEQRYKENEIVILRPDIKHVIALHRAKDPMDSKVVLIREFRSTSSTSDGYIHETPGGSGFKPDNPENDAAKEFTEETGVSIDPKRLSTMGARQVAGTTTTHKGHCFLLDLTNDEIVAIEGQVGETHGNKDETEVTHVEVYTVRQLLEQPITDWSNLGMIFAALNKAK